MKRSLKARYQARYGIKQSLRGYQLRAVARGCRVPAYALLMDPRLGKTRIDIAISGWHFLQGNIETWLIICPAIAKDVWATELRDTLAIPHTIEIVEGKREERRLLIKGWKPERGKLNILIINHEATWRLKKVLYKVKPHRVTVDESQKIGNHATNQSTAIHTLATHCEYRSILTGTLGGPMKVFSQFKFLDRSIFGTKWKRSRMRPDDPPGYLDRYVASYGYGGHKPKKWHRLGEMQEKIASVSFQLTRKEAGGFPEEVYQTFHFQLTNPAARHYAEMEEKLKTIVRNHEVTAPIVLTQTLRLQQITAGFLPIRCDDDEVVNTPLGDDRIRALRGLIEEYEDNEPLVIYARFRYELEAVLGLMRRMKRSANFIAGGMKHDVRDKAKWDFQKGKVDTCVVQIRAGGIAIDLSRADYGIFFTVPQSFIDYEQAKARIIARTGGHKFLLHLAATGTVDDVAIEALKNNADLAEAVMLRYRSAT